MTKFLHWIVVLGMFLIILPMLIVAFQVNILYGIMVLGTFLFAIGIMVLIMSGCD